MPDEICPEDEELRDWLVGRLPVEAAEALFAHLDGCPRCQAKLQTVSDVGDTLIDYLRQPWVRDELQDEPQFREAVARAKAIGDAAFQAQPSGRGGGAQAGHRWRVGRVPDPGEAGRGRDGHGLQGPAHQAGPGGGPQGACPWAVWEASERSPGSSGR